MTYELQLGDYRLILEGELEPTGGSFKLVAINYEPGTRIGSFILPGETVRLIALPDAPKTSAPNPDARR
jgi:hypothetical protein